MIFNTKNQISMKKIQNLYVDIELLDSKVDDYYLKYGELPILCNYTDKENFQNGLIFRAESEGAFLNNDINPNDGNQYAVIDLEKLEGITLNYGYDKDGEYFAIKNNNGVNSTQIEDEIYVINTTSHQIYFPHGIFADGTMYYRTNAEDEVAVVIPELELDPEPEPEPEPETYTISYNLNDGELRRGETNPTTYDIESEEMVLNNPIRAEYVFAGWTGTDLSNVKETVTIAKGSTGDRTYTANWVPANYAIDSVIDSSINSPLTSPQAYTLTLQESFNAAKENATITVLRDTIEAPTAITAAIINKTVTIDTNGKTLTRENSYIITTGGTLTIRGNGMINNTSDVVAIYGGGGNVAIRDNPTIKTLNNAIYVNNVNSSLDLQGGYLYSTGRTALCIVKCKDAIISNTWIYTPVKDRNAIVIGAENTGNLIIEGNSVIGNATKNELGLGTTADVESVSAISTASAGTITVRGNARVMSGPYGAHGITTHAKTKIMCLENCSIYALNTNVNIGASCVVVADNVNDSTIEFNSMGYFYCAGNYAGILTGRRYNESNQGKLCFSYK